MTISSLSSTAFHKLALSDFLCPSTCKLKKVADLNVLYTQLLVNRNPDLTFFKIEVVKRKWHYLNELLRISIRIACIFAIGVFIAPIGAVYHFYQTGKYCIVYLKNRDEENLRKVTAYAKAFFYDFSQMVLLGIMPTLTLFHAFNLITKSVFSISYLSFANLIWCAAFPSTLLKKEQSSFFDFILNSSVEESYLLKRELGIVNLKGDLFKTTINFSKFNGQFSQNVTISFREYFENLLKFKATILIDFIKALHGQGIAIERTYPPKLDEVIKSIDQSNVINKKTIKEEIKKHFDEFSLLNAFAEKGKNSGMITFSQYDHSFPISHTEYLNIFKKIPTQNGVWNQFVESKQAAITSLKLDENLFTEDYRRVRNRILAVNPTPCQVLGISDNPSPHILRQAFAKLINFLHDDRNPKEEATLLCEIVKEANKKLKQ